MTRLLEKDSLGYAIADKLDRIGGWLIYGQFRWISAILGDKLKAGTASPLEVKWAAWIDKYVAREESHCLKNAGKP